MNFGHFFRNFVSFKCFINRKLPVINFCVSSSCLLLQCKSQFMDDKNQVSRIFICDSNGI